MLKPRPTFGEVKGELIKLGFEVRYTSKHVFFKHFSGTPFFALPRYESGQRLSPIHALTIRTQLEHAGLIKEAKATGRGIGTARQGLDEVRPKKKNASLPKASKKPAAPKASTMSKAGKNAITPAAKVKAQIKGKAHV